MIFTQEIEGETGYSCHCDNCKDLFFEEHEGFSIRFAEDNLIEDIKNADWLIGSTKFSQGEDGKHYCPQCYKINDDDGVGIITSRYSNELLIQKKKYD